VTGLGPVARLADDLDVGLLLEDHLQATAEQRVVVDDQTRIGSTTRPADDGTGPGTVVSLKGSSNSSGRPGSGRLRPMYRSIRNDHPDTPAAPPERLHPRRRSERATRVSPRPAAGPRSRSRAAGRPRWAGRSRVGEQEEVVPDQLHLVQRVGGRHRLGDVGLVAHDERLGVVVGRGGGAPRPASAPPRPVRRPGAGGRLPGSPPWPRRPRGAVPAVEMRAGRAPCAGALELEDAASRAA
jgi:hypothetical protein